MTFPARWVWVETVSARRLLSPACLQPLARWGGGLFLAVTPDRLAALPRVLEGTAERGIPVGVWPMIADARGRWLAAPTVDPFLRHMEALWETVDRAGVVPVRLVLDLEPPLAVTRALLRGRPAPVWRTAAPRGWDRVRRGIATMVDETRARGVEPVAAVAPPVLLDPVRGPHPWQRALGTPVDGLGFARIHVMLYSSLFEGYLPGVGRRGARCLLALACRRARRRFGSRAAVSLGLTGGGALGDERPLRSIGELAEDAAVARAAGIEELALHGLGGALDRGEGVGWLQALG